MNPKITVLVCYHTDAPRIKDDVFAPIHLGRACASPEGTRALRDCIGDDTGENISDRNPRFCELTALYWAWKNLAEDVEYVGLMHYRRFLVFSERGEDVINWPFESTEAAVAQFGLDKEHVAPLCRQYDVICPVKTPIFKGYVYDLHKRFQCLTPAKMRRFTSAPPLLSFYEHYALAHFERDLRTAIRVVLEKHPEYLSFLDDTLEDTKGRFCNMFVMQRGLFNEYMAFLFGVLGEVERRLCFDGPEYLAGSYQGRVMGFLGERLLSIYIDALARFRPETRIKELPIVFFDGRSLERCAPAAKGSGILAASSETHQDSQSSPPSSTFDIVLASDNDYAQHLAVAIASILRNATDGESLSFHILDGGISETNRFRIEALKTIRDFEIEFLDVDAAAFAACPIPSGTWITETTYYRFLLPHLAPTIDKALYLDCDVVVLTSLRDLWATDVSGAYAAVAEDTWEYAAIHHKRMLGLSHADFYFNAGVMLVNLAKWREDGLSDALFAQMREMVKKGGTIQYDDQDVMNCVLRNGLIVLPIKWNVQQTAFYFTGCTRYSAEALEDARCNPALVHFSGAVKPWHPGCIHPLRKEYFTYLDMTSWRGRRRPGAMFDFLHRQRVLFASPVRHLARGFWMGSRFRRRIYGFLYDEALARHVAQIASHPHVRAICTLLRYAIVDTLTLGIRLAGFVAAVPLYGARKVAAAFRVLRRWRGRMSSPAGERTVPAEASEVPRAGARR